MYIFIIYINNTSLLQLYMMDQVESFREEPKRIETEDEVVLSLCNKIK